MKVLIINGSTRKDGNTTIAVNEIVKVFETEGIDTEVVQIGNKDVPVAGRIDHFEQYDTIYIGFPIWYGAQPKVVSTFCKGYDWNGKKVYVFATSGGSGIGKTAEKLTPFVEGATIVDARLVRSASEIQIFTVS